MILVCKLNAASHYLSAAAAIESIFHCRITAGWASEGNPLIYMRGVKFEVLTAMVDFFYRGEANVCQKNLDNFLALAAELQLKGLEENQNKENVAESDLMKTVKDKSPNPLKRVKSNPKANPQDVVPNKYYDGERNCSLPSEENVIALSDKRILQTLSTMCSVTLHSQVTMIVV